MEGTLLVMALLSRCAVRNLVCRLCSEQLRNSRNSELLLLRRRDTAGRVLDTLFHS